MSTHPNAMILLVLTPDNTARKTYRAILEESLGPDNTQDEIKIGGIDYYHLVMEGDYDEAFQIGAPEGSVVIMDFLTYGYGERKKWADVQQQKDDLETWAIGVCQRHHCNYEISISANYW